MESKLHRNSVVHDPSKDSLNQQQEETIILHYHKTHNQLYVWLTKIQIPGSSKARSPTWFNPLNDKKRKCPRRQCRIKAKPNRDRDMFQQADAKKTQYKAMNCLGGQLAHCMPIENIPPCYQRVKCVNMLQRALQLTYNRTILGGIRGLFTKEPSLHKHKNQKFFLTK